MSNNILNHSGYDPDEFDRAKLRKMLIQALGDEDLITIAFDHFHDTYEKFASGMTRTIKIQILIEDCYRLGRIEKLLKTLAQYRPTYDWELVKNIHNKTQPIKNTKELSSEPSEFVEISISNINFSDLSAKQIEGLTNGFKVALASALNLSVIDVQILNVKPGSVILEAILPSSAIEQLIEGNSLLQELGIEKVSRFVQPHEYLDFNLITDTKNKRELYLSSPTKIMSEHQQTNERNLTLQNPDFIFVSSAYGKNGMGNPQIFIDITANFLLKTNLLYGGFLNQSINIRTVDNNGKPQKIIAVSPKYKFQAPGNLMISHLPDMLFTVLIRGYTLEYELKFVCLSLLGDKLARLIDIVKDKSTFNTVACETEILYEGNDLPKGADLTKLSKDFRYNISQINLELGSSQKPKSKQSFLGKIFGFK